MTDVKDDDNLGSFYMGRMRNPPEPRRVLPKGMLTAVTLFAFGAIIWYAYPQGAEKFARLDIPTITADKNAYKFKPENPGGMEVLHQDSTVFDPIDNKSADSAKIEKLGAPPEEPVDKDSVLSTSPIDKTPERLNLDMQIKETSGGVEQVVPAAEPAPKVDAKVEAPKVDKKVETVTEAPKPPQPAPAVVAETPKPAPAPKVVAETPKPAPAPKVVAEAPKPAPVAKKTEKVVLMSKSDAAVTPPPVAAPVIAPPVKGGVYIQLGSYRDLKAAKEDWAKLQKKYPQSIGKMAMHLEKADLGAKGVYHRLQSKAESEDRAKRICKVLKASGNPDCIVVK